MLFTLPIGVLVALVVLLFSIAVLFELIVITLPILGVSLVFILILPLQDCANIYETVIFPPPSYPIAIN